MINKKHLLDSIKEEYPFISEDFYEMVKGFPEEQEIDFDVLFVEWINSHCDNISNGCGINPVETASCFKDFLKSKHLTAPKPKQIPVKKFWTLKKEWEKLFLDFGFDNIRYWGKLSEEPGERLLKYYDYHEEPDYSQIPVGAVVKLVFVDDTLLDIYGELIRNDIEIQLHNSLPFERSKIKSLEILKMPENVK